VFAENFTGQGKCCRRLLGGGRFARRDSEVALCRIRGERANLATNFHCAGVSQAGGGCASILPSHQALSDGSLAEDQ
jgi:hypothetical protein